MALVDDYDGVIFDFGNVLVAPQTEADVAAMAAVMDVTPPVFSDYYWANRLNYDRGDLSASSYWNDIAHAAGRELTPGQVDQLVSLDNAGWMRFDEPMWEWIAELRRAGKPVAILSNMPRELGEALSGTDRLSFFDQHTLSYEVRVVKPEPEIYEHCLEGLGTAADKTIFFDDRIENIQGAEMLGIRSVQFLDRQDIFLRFRFSD